METIKMFLKKAIENRGIKLSYIAGKIGISADLLSKTINGTRRLTADEFLKICKVLNVTQDEIDVLAANVYALQTQLKTR